MANTERAPEADADSIDPHAGENVGAKHAPAGTSDTHTRFTPEERADHRKPYDPGEEATQRQVWRLFFIGLLALLAVAVFLAVRR